MTIARIVSFLLALVVSASAYAFNPNPPDPVVIVASYNPDVKSISDNINAFTEVYSKAGFENPVALESMHCLNLPECVLWKDRLWNLLEKYYTDGHKPAAIVLLGTEASAAYFSTDIPVLKQTPVVFGLRGDNISLLPDDDVKDLSSWQPKSYSITRDFKGFNIIGGVVYDYDIENTIRLIEGIPNKIDTLAFISDNTFGGVTMQSHFLERMKSMPQYAVKCLDGRNLTFHQLDYTLSVMPSNTALVLGTWRIDSSDSYALNNTTRTLAFSNPGIPAVSLASVGLGHWALGGYVPDYITQGGVLAQAVVDYLSTGMPSEVVTIGNHYNVDYNVAKNFGFSYKTLSGSDYILINEPSSFFKEHKTLILLSVLAFLLLASCLVLTTLALIRSKHLQHNLEKRGEELAAERDRAEKANAMKSSFIANISHEIRTPLNAVIGFSQFLSSDTFELSAEEKKEYCSHILLNSNVLLNLIDQVLDLSKMDADRITYNYKTINLVDLANAAAEATRLKLQAEVEVLVNTPREVIEIETDREKLYQVFCNLLSNARKFTSEGCISIDLEPDDNTGMVTIKVTDTGSGIPQDKVSTIFDRFVKLDPYKQGTGLGLSIVKTIVDHLGGEIHVDTGYTGGARFVFTHPYRIGGSN